MHVKCGCQLPTIVKVCRGKRNSNSSAPATFECSRKVTPKDAEDDVQENGGGLESSKEAEKGKTKNNLGDAADGNKCSKPQSTCWSRESNLDGILMESAYSNLDHAAEQL